MVSFIDPFFLPPFFYAPAELNNAPNLWIIPAVVSRTGYPDSCTALRAMCKELCPALVLEYSFAVLAPQLYHTNNNGRHWI
jgi:hypothetical protein